MNLIDHLNKINEFYVKFNIYVKFKPIGLIINIFSTVAILFWLYKLNLPWK